jgi:ribosomal protein S18 acetylase RimI-like enzyme
MLQNHLPAQTTIRNMQEHDLASVLQIQQESFDDATQESQPSFQAKLTASPSTCFVAVQGQSVVGYLVALLADSENPPALNGDSYKVPPLPNCLYLHDLSVSRRVRGTGVAAALIQAFLQALKRHCLPKACLTAVNDSSSYWERYGFQVVSPSGQVRDRLATYGSGATYMVLVDR